MIPHLPATYVDHVVAPGGIGDVPDAHAVGEVGSMVGGLGVRMSLAYEADGNGDSKIVAAAGRAFGSAAPLAPISWLAAAVDGQTWTDACEHTADSVLTALNEGNGRSMPEAVERGAEFAVGALRRALGVCSNGAPADPAGPGLLVCRCIGVGDRTIRRAVRAGAHDPEAVGDATGACTGCRSCRPDVLALIHDEITAPAEAPDADLHPAARIALARVGPVLAALGLPLAAARVDGAAVHIQLGEAQPQASISPIGAVAVTRHMLRELVGEDVEVTPDVP